MDSMRVAKISLQNDIYSLAYAAFLDPDQLDKSVPGGLQPIRMNEEEVMNIFIAAIIFRESLQSSSYWYHHLTNFLRSSECLLLDQIVLDTHLV